MFKIANHYSPSMEVETSGKFPDRGDDRPFAAMADRSEHDSPSMPERRIGGHGRGWVGSNRGSEILTLIVWDHHFYR